MNSTLDKHIAFEEAVSALDKNKFIFRGLAGSSKPIPYLTVTEVGFYLNGVSFPEEERIQPNEILGIAKYLGYSVIQDDDNSWIILLKKTPGEIEALKTSWLKDPCWDIETTKGFEAHREELLAYRELVEADWHMERIEKDQARMAMVTEITGVTDADIATSLHLWHEIERDVKEQDKYIGHTEEFGEIMAELAQAQVRATLLQAAQLKRIADALDDICGTLDGMDDGDSLERLARIWGAGK